MRVKQFLASALALALAMSSVPAIAGSGTLPVTPGSGATLRVGTDGSTNLFGNGAICDGAACAVLAAVKAASTAPVATDPALVVGLSPNGNQSTAANQANPQRWIAGNGFGATPTAVFGTEVNSLPSLDSVLSSVAIANQTALDTYIDISASVSSFTSGAGAPSLQIYACPLNQDGTTYCSNQITTTPGAIVPLSPYFMCSIQFIPSLAATAQTGDCGSLFPIVPQSIKLIAYNLAGNILGSTVTIKATTFNLAFH